MVLMRKLSYLSHFNEVLIEACDTSFLYWHRLIIPVYFDYLLESKTEAYRLHVRVELLFLLLKKCIFFFFSL